jgi:regulator of RNase E activity RraA
MKPPLTYQELNALRRLDACTLANAIEIFNERLRNEGFVSDTVRCLFPRFQPMLGYAATIKIRGSSPPTAARPYDDRTDWWDYILSVPGPRVLIVEDVATRPGLGSLVGAVHMNILRALHCVGVVTNGSVRDIPAAESAGFHLFAGCTSVSHAYTHILETGTPVEIGGLKIQSGDLIHGDIHGVQSIPIDIAGEIPAAAAKLRAQEERIISFCRSSDFSIDKLRALVKEPL